MNDELNCPNHLVTSHGLLHLEEPSPSIISRLHSLLPFGLRISKKSVRGARYGIVAQSGEECLQFVKQQPPDVSIEMVQAVHMANNLLIASTIPSFLVEGHEGCFWPLNYLRKKPNGFEIGFAYSGMERAGDGCEEPGRSRDFDEAIGYGFTDMMYSFIQNLKDQSKKTGLSLQHTIGLDVCDRNHLRNISFGFLLLDQDVICLKPSIRADDPVLTVLRANGIDTVIHMPAVPIDLGVG
ncbi:MAG: hypothetical protein ACSHX8_07325 [Opitutaceae bacterium]